MPALATLATLALAPEAASSLSPALSSLHRRLPLLSASSTSPGLAPLTLPLARAYRTSPDANPTADTPGKPDPLPFHVSELSSSLRKSLRHRAQHFPAVVVGDPAYTGTPSSFNPLAAFENPSAEYFNVGSTPSSTSTYASATSTHVPPSAHPLQPISATTRARIRGVGAGSCSLDLAFAPGVACITLSNPSKRNAMSGKVVAEFADALDVLERVCERGDGETGAGKEVVAVIVRGAGGIFSAGSDLTAAKTHPETVTDIHNLMVETIARLRRLNLITCAAIDGYALGGSTELLSACDHRVMAENAVIRFVQVNMGLSTAWGGGSSLVRTVGRSNALQILGGSPKITAPLALKLRLADHVGGPGQDATSAAAEWLAQYVWEDPDAAVKCGAALPASSVGGAPGAGAATAGTWQGLKKHAVAAVRGIKSVVVKVQDERMEDNAAYEKALRERLIASEGSKRAMGGAITKKI
ncbi:ClpP/crotonase [Gonapodya prolifera JEL478]|uniref:ClpP/crotonase n=1 Tax=Gonapodya prolifera (strain JEL478) TaxID=1344416 RepID=A0A139A9K4_GONPJ|nr:ClpP/crotonase [Gonapodya prolifera JEL478]|eukprot:KXS13348.1 ClpP/crotonase [Gonapodya prolifera JEL478]